MGFLGRSNRKSGSLIDKQGHRDEFVRLLHYAAELFWSFP